MKKLLTLIAFFGILFIGVNNSYAQEPDSIENNTDTSTTVVEDTEPQINETEDVAEEEAAKTEGGRHQKIKAKFIEGGADFMGIILLVLILGLAISLERVIYLSLATTNVNKLLKNVEKALETGGVDEAKEVCRSTRGPIASIFYQGLERADQNIEVVEKAVISYGSVQMGILEKGLTWVSLFISIAPMLGFMGTVLGMIQAFEAIEAAGNVSAGLVAHGIQIALITTVTGLIVAIILQIFYNYIVSKIDSLVNKMEDSSISLIDILVKHKLTHSK